MRGETVGRLRAGAPTTDEYGTPIPGVEVEVPITGAAFAPGGSTEPAQTGMARVVITPTLYFHHSWPDIISSDRIRVRGLIYSVIGQPPDWRSPFVAGEGGLVVELKAVE